MRFGLIDVDSSFLAFDNKAIALVEGSVGIENLQCRRRRTDGASHPLPNES
jgi:hypothetical protein